MQYAAAILVAVYLACAFAAASADGLTGVDVWYLIAASVTTVGLGDISPSNQGHRAATIFLLPLGLIVLSFGISIVQARALSRIDPADAISAVAPIPGNAAVKWWVDSKGTALQAVIIMCAKFTGVILIGAAFFLLNEHEQDFQERDNTGEFTFVDAAFFSTVISTTVGYGHRLAPMTDSAKGFLIVYFFFSTIVVGGIINDLSNLHLEKNEREIEEAIIDSTIWLHKADLENIGSITEPDYILFKLRQLQKVDERILNLLATRFDELDVKEDGFLSVGLEIPSAEQVQEMQLKTTQPREVMKLWDEMRPRLLLEAAQEALATPEEAARHRLKAVLDPQKTLANVHDFAWSRQLWSKAARQTCLLACGMGGVYLVLGNFLLSRTYQGHVGPVWSWYFLSATMSTVGLGDFAPRTQFTRGFAIVLLPFGLVIIGFFMSCFRAYQLSIPPKLQPNPLVENKKEEQFNTIVSNIKESQSVLDSDNDGKVSKEELIAAAGLLALSVDEAAALFDQLDPEHKGFLEFEKYKVPWYKTLPGRLFLLLLRLLAVVLVGALFMYLHPSEDQGLTFIDAMYFATVVATSVGYGDIVPQSDAGRIFMTVYMLVATVWVGIILNEFIVLFVEDYIGEGIVDEIIDSMTFVYKCDLEGDGAVSEADYILFKLQQMQKVHRPTLKRLAEKFDSLDSNHNGTLAIGAEIPSAEQVVELQKLVAEVGGPCEGRTLMEAWNTMLLPSFVQSGKQDEALKASVEKKQRSLEERHQRSAAKQQPALSSLNGEQDEGGEKQGGGFLRAPSGSSLDRPSSGVLLNKGTSLDNVSSSIPESEPSTPTQRRHSARVTSRAPRSNGRFDNMDMSMNNAIVGDPETESQFETGSRFDGRDSVDLDVGMV